MFALFSWATAFAQVTTARLQGTITDPSGAAIPNATITITNTGTGLVTKVTSNARGLYVAPALPAGHYRVVVVKPGFQRSTRTMTLSISQVAVADFQLSVGAVTQSVTVKGGAPLLHAADSTISHVIVGPQITQLPLNEQNFTQLATLTPGVTRGVPTGIATGSQNNAETFRYGQAGGASLAVNGLPPQANNFVLDGITNNEALVNTIVIFSPFDAIQEFRVVTNNASAQYGGAGGGIIEVLTKSGTNNFHGDAYYYHRDQSLDSIPFFNTSKTPFARNFFGGSLGGPILKNRLFFFMDYRGLRMNVPQESSVGTVPTDLMRQGNFSELLCPGNPTCAGTGLSAPVRIINPLTGTQFMGNGSQPNVIPADQINKVGQNYLNAFPQPNCNPSTDSRCGTIINNYVNSRSQIENWNDFDVRLDYDLSSKDRFFGRFTRDRADQTSTTFLTTLPSGFGSGTNFNHPYGLALGWTHIFSPNLLSQMHLGFVRTTYGYTPPDEGIPLCTQLGIVNCNTSPLLGGIALIGGGGSQIEYTGDYGPYLVPQTGIEWNDAMTWIHGNHDVTFGASIIRQQLNLFRPLAGKGFFNLFANGGSGSPTHYEVSDLLAGFVGTYDIGPPYGMVGTRNWENGFFVEDDWNVRPRLTLNLGLRYDVITWPLEVFNRQSNFNINTGQLYVAGFGGSSRALIPQDWLNFNPRLGFAYQLTPDGKTVVRGGFGMFSYLDRGGISNQLAQNPPFSGEQSFNYNSGYRITLSGQTGSPTNNNATQATQPLPLGYFPSSFNLTEPQNVSVFASLPSNRIPRVAEWNFQVERQLSQNMSLSVGYVGDHGFHEMTYYNYNAQPFGEPVYGTAPSAPNPFNPCQSNLTVNFPCLNSVTVQASVGTSDYNSMQIQFQRRMTAGWQFLGSFTWQKILNTSCGAFDCTAPQDYLLLQEDRGYSQLDQPYVMVLSSLYELPFGRGKRWGSHWSRLVDLALGGWEVNGIYTLQAGLPFDLSVGGSSNAVLRPNATCLPGTQPGNLQHYVVGGSCLSAPAATLYGSGNNIQIVANAPGTAARNLLFGPGLSNMDLSASKSFSMTETSRIEFSVQAYNLTNTPHFGQPNGQLGSYQDTCTGGGSTGPCTPVFDPNPFFGQITNTIPYSNRQVELGVRIIF
jgi:hypothetical protein